MGRRTSLAKILQFAGVALAIALTSKCPPAAAENIGFHPARVDGSNNIVPWFSTDLGAAYDHTAHLVFDWWLARELAPNGLKHYLVYDQWPGRDGVGGDQLAMALSSWSLFYAYTGDRRALDDMKYIADYYLGHSLSAPNTSWPNLPFPYNTVITGDPLMYDGDFIAGPGVLQPDKAGSFGAELITLYKITGIDNYLAKAVAIADTLAARIQPGDAAASPWPFRVNANSGAVVDGYTAGWTGCLRLFDGLIELGQRNAPAYAAARSVLSSWLKSHPLNPADPASNAWGPFFEDVAIYSDTEINADTMAWYILEHPTWDARGNELARRTLDWSYDTFKDSTWSASGVTAIREQTAYQVPGNSHTARHYSVELIYAEKTGDSSRKAAAIRGLNWATYWVSVDGTSMYPDGSVWMTDGYGDYLRHFMRAMGAAPELAPADQNHLLRTTSVVKDVRYANHDVRYTVFDGASKEVLRISFVPTQVTSDGRALPRLSAAFQLATAEGYVFQSAGDASGVLRIRHDSGTTIAVIDAASGGGVSDGGVSDAGTADGGQSEEGPPGPPVRRPASGSGCGETGQSAWSAVAGFVFLFARRIGRRNR